MITSGEIYKKLQNNFDEIYKADMERLSEEALVKFSKLSKDDAIAETTAFTIVSTRDAMFRSISNVLQDLLSSHSS